ncbi:glycosyltransferase family 4 protein [Marinivivus vitaminiproducens]|uniref:glycosyltransferase family 4 protein n=1 Tax=Marinivivus vitaminiproducens TaxID=3035935 RepID=UPI0027A29D18|nr:glycosyltransferase family 4 protein [Geminicoccaceae bacterium SCSIO 64248]
MSKPRKIVVHDYAGHPFQVQLSRKLASRGHEVHHLYFSADKTPRGALQKTPSDPATFHVVPVDIKGEFKKYNLVARVRQEGEYGRAAAEVINRLAPDVLINANVPVEALRVIRQRCRTGGRSFVIWLQDILSVGVSKLAKEKLPVVGGLVGQYFLRTEKKTLNAADHIVCITPDFLSVLQDWKVDTGKCSVIENWAPIEEIHPFKGESSWRAEHGLVGKRIVLYSGTLGLKHNPGLLVAAAKALASDHRFDDVVLVVVAEGMGANLLKAEKDKHGLANLRLMGFQPYEKLSEILSQAEVLLAVIEKDAGIFSVPSKVLSYMCAGRPVLLSTPTDNLATKTVERAKAGTSVPPDDAEAFTRALLELLADPTGTAELGRNARAYAERTFDIETIADRFETIWS